MDVEALVARYENVSQAEEEALLKAILQRGWEAGCWLRPEPEKLFIDTPVNVARVLEGLANRANFKLALGEDPYPDGLPQSPITGTDPCMVVVSQRCDLIGPLKNEPFVELAPTGHTSSKDAIKGRWKNSYREFPVDPGAADTFLVDLRHRFWLPRIDLLEFEARQALRPNEDAYRTRWRFGLRVGQRYNRAALPDALVDGVLKPLDALIRQDAEVDSIFMEWMLHHGDRREEKPGLIAVFGFDDKETDTADAQDAREASVRIAAEDKFEEIVANLPETARDALDLDGERSGAFDEAELSVAIWRTSWKLDFDAYTFGGEGGGAPPTR
jgi:hypothetical protein